MKILVVGTGYVGLVTGACFAEMGHHVTCLDIDSAKIDKLNAGIIPIYEPGLEEIVKRNIENKKLLFTTNYKEAAFGKEICFLAVPTPEGHLGACDLSYIKKAATSLALEMQGYMVVVNKSTVPLGTGKFVSEVIEETLAKRACNVSFDVVSNPEFLKEGDAISDFMYPDRIVIGCESERAKKVMQELYAPFNLKPECFFFMDLASAEMTKYAANAMLASRISFINEMALLCETLGADIRYVKQAIGADKRIGPMFLNPGVGYGGSCFPKDIKALHACAEAHGQKAPMLQAIDEVNQRQKELMAKKLQAYFETKGGLHEKTIGIWGLSFKPGTDDIREAPSLTLIKELLQKGVYLKLFDPVAMKNMKEVIKPNFQITYAQDPRLAAKETDALVLMTEWPLFKSQDLPATLLAMRGKAFFDGRNQFDPKMMEEIGFDYFYVGQKCPVFSIK